MSQNTYVTFAKKYEMIKESQKRENGINHIIPPEYVLFTQSV